VNVNRQWCVGARPDGKPKPSDFLYKESPIASPDEGEVLLETLYLGIAPVMRMYMMNSPQSSEPPLAIGDVIHGRGVARIVESRHPEWQIGEIVQGQLGWQTYKVSKMTARERFLRVKHHDISYAHSVRVLSMTGLTAYTGFFNQGQPKIGETVVVSGAAGGVGHMVVQMAKIMKCRVIGIAGGAEKCGIVSGLGANDIIDYKNDDVPAKLAELCPNGIDIYFDNVGGEILEACLSISEYTLEEKFGLKNYARLRDANATMHGYFVYNYLDQFETCTAQLVEWIKTGQMKPLLDELKGFDKMPEALIGVYDGTNVGTRCVKVKLEE